jgi:hypothetical protein
MCLKFCCTSVLHVCVRLEVRDLCSAALFLLFFFVSAIHFSVIFLVITLCVSPERVGETHERGFSAHRTLLLL